MIARPGKNVDHELLAGSSAHYEDTAYYEKTYAKRTDDVAFYVQRAAALAKKTKRAAGQAESASILEYGCGNGRVTLPLAREGHTILGVDLSEPMLQSLRTKLALEPPEVRARVQTRHGDMRALALRRKFELVLCPFNTFLHLYEREDVERFLARVRAHLAPRGRLLVDVSIPEPSELARPSSRLYRTRPFVYPGVGRVRYGERFDYDGLRQVLFVSMHFEPENGSRRFMTPLTHRQFYPRELEALLHYNGFSIEEQIGDFSGPAEPSSRHLSIVASVRRMASSKPTRRS